MKNVSNCLNVQHDLGVKACTHIQRKEERKERERKKDKQNNNLSECEMGGEGILQANAVSKRAVCCGPRARMRWG